MYANYLSTNTIPHSLFLATYLIHSIFVFFTYYPQEYTY